MCLSTRRRDWVVKWRQYDTPISVWLSAGRRSGSGLTAPPIRMPARAMIVLFGCGGTQLTPEQQQEYTSLEGQLGDSTAN